MATEQNGNGHFFKEVKVSIISALIISMIFGIWNMWTSIGKNELEQLRLEFMNAQAMQKQSCERDFSLHETQTNHKFEQLENKTTDTNAKIRENESDIRELFKEIQNLNLTMQRFSFVLEQKYKQQNKNNDAPSQPFYLFPKALPSISKTPCPRTANGDKDDCDKTTSTIEVDSDDGSVKKKALEHQNHVIIEK